MYNDIFTKPVWSSKAFQSQINSSIVLPKSNMNQFEVGMLILSSQPIPLFSSLHSTIEAIRMGFLGSTFSLKSLKDYLDTTYKDNLSSGDLTLYEGQALSHIFTELTEVIYKDKPSLGSKQVSLELLKLSINWVK